VVWLLDSVLRQEVSRDWRNLIFLLCIVPAIKASLNQSFLLISNDWWSYRLLDRLILDWLVVKILPVLVRLFAKYFRTILVLGLIKLYILVRVLFVIVWEPFLSHHAFGIFISILESVSSHLGNTWLFFWCSEVDPCCFHYIWRLGLVLISRLQDCCLLLPAFPVIDASARERRFRFVAAARRVKLLEMRLSFVSISSYILTGRHSFSDWIVNAIDLHCSLSHSLLVTRWLVFRVFSWADLLGHGSDWSRSSRGQRFIVTVVNCFGVLSLRLNQMLLHQRALNRLVVIQVDSVRLHAITRQAFHLAEGHGASWWSTTILLRTIHHDDSWWIASMRFTRPMSCWCRVWLFWRYYVRSRELDLFVNKDQRLCRCFVSRISHSLRWSLICIIIVCTLTQDSISFLWSNRLIGNEYVLLICALSLSRACLC